MADLVTNAGEWLVNDWLDDLIAAGKVLEVRPVSRRDVLTLLRQLQEVIIRQSESSES